jgi:hypothetical protein
MSERRGVGQVAAVAIAIGIADVTLTFPGPSGTGPDGRVRTGRSAHGDELVAALAGLELWLRDRHGRCIPLHRTARRFTGQAACYAATVPPGPHLLCAGPLPAPFRFPARTVIAEPGRAEHTFRLVTGDGAYFRTGRMLLPLGPSNDRLAVVLAPTAGIDGAARHRSNRPLRTTGRPPGSGAVDAVAEVLARHGYRRLIDLTRLPSSAGSPATTTDRRVGIAEHAEPVVLEFAATSTAATPADTLIVHRDQLAVSAGLLPAGVRPGRLVAGPAGTAVIDNEFVLGFTATFAGPQARHHLGAAGATVLEDLSTGDEPGPILLARFTGRGPAAASTAVESLLDAGLLHWAEPNLVEY